MTIAATTRDKIKLWQSLKTPANADEQNLYDLLSIFASYHSSLAQTTQLKLDQWLDSSIVNLQSGGSGIASSDFTQLDIAAAGLAYNPWSLSMNQMIAVDDYLDVLLSDDYASRVLATSPIAYWKLNEGSGSTIIDSSGNGYNGSYTGVTWDGTAPPQGGVAPFWDGANDYGNVYSAGLGSAFSFSAGTMMIWVKPDSWGSTFTLRMMSFTRDGTNRVSLAKLTTPNTPFLQYFAGGVSKAATAAITPTAGFNLIALTWSKAADEVKGYHNGVQFGGTQSSLGTPTGSGLSATQTMIGALNVTPTEPFLGYLAHAAVWDRALTAAEILALYNAGVA